MAVDTHDPVILGDPLDIDAMVHRWVLAVRVHKEVLERREICVGELIDHVVGDVGDFQCQLPGGPRKVPLLDNDGLVIRQLIFYV